MIGQKKRLTASAARRKHSVTAAIFDCCTLICRIGEKLAVYPSQMPRVLIDIEERSMTIKVALNAGQGMNYHSHEKRDEVWTVISGSGKAVVDGRERVIKAGDVISMPSGCKHMVIAETELIMIEVQLGEVITIKDKHKHELTG